MFNQPLFLNKWAKGSSENANLGNGVFVGVEIYSKKGVAQLTKDTVKVSGSVVTDLPLYSTARDINTIFVQGDTGKVYKSIDSGDTWTDITNASSSGAGQGIIYFQGFLFAFRGGKIDYNSGSFTSTWTQSNWIPTGGSGIFNGSKPLPIIIFPNDGFVYFGNGSQVGKLGFGTANTFNPAGSANVDYFYDYNWGGTTQSGILPSFYEISSISFLPTNYLALGTSSSIHTDVADLILWNPTLSTYETPLRLYSQAQASENGIKQLINRNNVLYAVVGGSHSIFRTNGQSFSLVADLSLSSNIRKIAGMQAQLPVFMNPRVGAIDIFGNKILTGVSTPEYIGNYPSSYGLFPCGVWSIAMEGSKNAIDYESDSTQCEYTISTGTIVAVNKQFVIGMLRCIGDNQTLIGWQDGTSYGIDKVSTDNYQNDINTVMIESEMMEIGTPLNPDTVQNIQLNTPRQLLSGQTVQFNYRTGYDQDYTAIPLGTFTSANNNDNGYKISANSIGATRFLQLQIQMASTSDVTYSPELRNIIISP